MSTRLTTAERNIETNEEDIRENEAGIVAERSARVSADAAAATARQALAARVASAERGVASNEAAIEAESQARASADSAEASARETLASRVNTFQEDIIANEAAIETERRARISADQASANVRAALSARINDAQADIVTERRARITNDAALTGLIQAISARVDGIDGGEVNVTEIATAVANELGLEGRWSVQVNVDGVITGIEAIGSDNESDIVIAADRFRIVGAVGGASSGVQIFQTVADDGTGRPLVGINGNLVVNGTITTNSIALNAVTLTQTLEIDHDQYTDVSRRQIGSINVALNPLVGDSVEGASILFSLRGELRARLGRVHLEDEEEFEVELTLSLETGTYSGITRLSRTVHGVRVITITDDREVASVSFIANLELPSDGVTRIQVFLSQNTIGRSSGDAFGGFNGTLISQVFKR